MASTPAPPMTPTAATAFKDGHATTAAEGGHSNKGVAGSVGPAKGKQSSRAMKRASTWDGNSKRSERAQGGSGTPATSSAGRRVAAAASQAATPGTPAAAASAASSTSAAGPRRSFIKQAPMAAGLARKRLRVKDFTFYIVVLPVLIFLFVILLPPELQWQDLLRLISTDWVAIGTRMSLLHLAFLTVWVWLWPIPLEFSRETTPAATTTAAATATVR
ncbi:hypothetical protein Agub_g9408, partial [Astrephomene gubernaculifera]